MTLTWRTVYLVSIGVPAATSSASRPRAFTMRAPLDESLPSLTNSSPDPNAFELRDQLTDGLVVFTFQILALRLGPCRDEENGPVDR